MNVPTLPSFLMRSKRFWLYFVVATVFFLLAGWLSYVSLASENSPETTNSSELTSAELFQQKLNSLHDALSVVSENITYDTSYTSDIDLMESSLGDYASALSDGIQACEAIVDTYESLNTAELPDDFADTASNSRGLCSDALLVLTYASAVSDALESYLLFDETSLSDQVHLEELVHVSQQSIDGLQDIQRPGIEDPGRQEIIVQLENTRDIGAGMLGDLQRGDEVSVARFNELQSRVQSDKQNFLNARVYYWSNTVLLSRMQAATTRIYNEF